MSSIRVRVGDIVVTALLNESATAQLLAGALPLESKAQIWGDEIYFAIPLETGEENPQADVPSGTVAYWPPGRALCLFFGQTPYSPVNVVGDISGDCDSLASIRDGETVRVELA